MGDPLRLDFVGREVDAAARTSRNLYDRDNLEGHRRDSRRGRGINSNYDPDSLTVQTSPEKARHDEVPASSAANETRASRGSTSVNLAITDATHTQDSNFTSSRMQSNSAKSTHNVPTSTFVFQQAFSANCKLKSATDKGSTSSGEKKKSTDSDASLKVTVVDELPRQRQATSNTKTITRL